MEVHYQPRSRVLYDAPAKGGTNTWTSFQPAAERRARNFAESTPHRSRLRLVANHGRWYHWPTVAPRVAAEATSQAFRGWRRAEIQQRSEKPAPRTSGGRPPTAGPRAR